MVSLVPRPPPFSVLRLCSVKYMEAEERTEEKEKKNKKQINKQKKNEGSLETRLHYGWVFGCLHSLCSTPLSKGHKSG